MSELSKTDLRRAGMHAVGSRLDDILEASKAELARSEGGLRVAKKALERSIQLAAAVDKEIDDGQIELEQGSLVKAYVVRTQTLMADLIASEEKRAQVAQGMVLGLERAVREAKAIHDREGMKVEREAPSSIKAERQAEPMEARA